MEDSLTKLKELTPQLPDISEVGFYIKHINNSNRVAYVVKGGFVITEALFNIPEIAIAKGSAPKGLKFPEHDHPEKEYILIYKGSVLLVMNGKEHVLEVGDIGITEPDIPHSLVALEYTEYIVIVIPSSKDYPIHDTTT